MKCVTIRPSSLAHSSSMIIIIIRAWLAIGVSKEVAIGEANSSKQIPVEAAGVPSSVIIVAFMNIITVLRNY